MTSTFLLHWVSTKTGFSGHGTHAFPSYSSITKYINSLKKENKYPYIVYEAKVAPPGTPLLNVW